MSNPKALDWVRTIAVGIGLMCIGYGGFLAYKSRTTWQWQPAQGTILATDIIQMDGRPGRKPRFRNRVTYTYEVAGKTWTADRIGEREIITDNTRYLEKVRDSYFKGRMVDVFYNPENPAEAVLKRGAGPGALFMIAVGVFVLTGGFLIPYLLKLKPDAPEQAAKA